MDNLGLVVDNYSLIMMLTAFLAGFIVGMVLFDWLGRRKRREEREKFFNRLLEMRRLKPEQSNYEADYLDLLLSHIDSALESIKIREFQDPTKANVRDEELMNLPWQQEQPGPR